MPPDGYYGMHPTYPEDMYHFYGAPPGYPAYNANNMEAFYGQTNPGRSRESRRPQRQESPMASRSRSGSPAKRSYSRSPPPTNEPKERSEGWKREKRPEKKRDKKHASSSRDILNMTYEEYLAQHEAYYGSGYPAQHGGFDYSSGWPPGYAFGNGYGHDYNFMGNMPR